MRLDSILGKSRKTAGEKIRTDPTEQGAGRAHKTYMKSARHPHLTKANSFTMSA
jgi:hypothetical protein